MRAALRTLLVLLIGAAVAFLLYVAADLTWGVGSGGMSTSFSPVISAWRSIGGSAGGMEGRHERGGPEGSAFGAGMPPLVAGGDGDGDGGTQFGERPRGERPEGGPGGRHGGGLGEGINLDRALSQTGSDMLWIGIPALLGVLIEVVWWQLRRRRRPQAA